MGKGLVFGGNHFYIYIFIYLFWGGGSWVNNNLRWFGWFFYGGGGLGQIAKLSLAKPQVNPNWTELAIVSFDPAGQPNHPPYPPTHL